MGHCHVSHNNGALLSLQLLSDKIARIKTFNLQEHADPGTAFYALLHIWRLESQSDDADDQLSGPSGRSGPMFDVKNFSVCYSHLTNS